MYVVAVTVWVKPEHVDAFIEASLDNARNTRREPGNVRWDFCRSEDDPTRFLLYDAYTTKDGFTQHKQPEHYPVTCGDTKVNERTFRFPRVRHSRRPTGPMSEARKQAIRDGQRRAARRRLVTSGSGR